ncbi:MAG: hypothetical protein M1824_002076 [Vezdaea acicularis]|nr:MAG: hypothetical protein M1824_002076 [Vezdaea acicularis]
MSDTEDHPSTPSRPWRYGSNIVMGVFGGLSRIWLKAFSKTQVDGLDGFMQVLDERKDIEGRERGLITVSNHISVVDDPLVWGALPLRYCFNADNMRWTLGSYDICFTNKFLSTFFTFGQVLPTHRIAYSPYGGLFQPTMTQTIRLLSHGPYTPPTPPSTPSSTTTESLHSASKPNRSIKSPDISDPFSSPHLTYSTNTIDTFPAPSAYPNRRHSWIHIFPEGKVHQHPDRTMRYFKWGVARLLLEADPLPRLVPIWIDGPQHIMHEERPSPRWLPSTGEAVRIVFGQEVDVERVFGDLRRRWEALTEREGEEPREMGVLSERLKFGKEAVDLRMEVTKRVRMEVLKVRKSAGLDDEDPKAGLVETWRAEGGAREGRMLDGSLVKED